MNWLKSEEMPSFLKVALASLPLLWAFEQLQDAVLLGAVVSAVYWSLILFFYRFGEWFPFKVKKFSFVITAIVIAQASWYVLGMTPLWAVSVILLAPQDLFQKKRKRRKHLNKEAVMLGVGFLALAVYLGFCEEILLKRFLIQSFAEPAGLLLLLALAAVIWKNQPLGEVQGGGKA